LIKDTEPPSQEQKRDHHKDKTLKIDFSQFLEIMIKKMSEKDSTEEIQSGFKLFDLDGDEYITFADLKKVAEELKEAMTDEEIYEMLRAASKNQDGEEPRVTSTDFFNILSQNNQ
jgi:centrin-1